VQDVRCSEEMGWTWPQAWEGRCSGGRILGKEDGGAGCFGHWRRAHLSRGILHGHVWSPEGVSYIHHDPAVKTPELSWTFPSIFIMGSLVY